MTPSEVALMKASITKLFGAFTPPAKQALNGVSKRSADVAAKAVMPSGPRADTVSFFSISIPKLSMKTMKNA